MLDEGRERGSLWDMPRAMRVEYPGAIYHVMDRGDRQDLLKTLAEACRKTDWQVRAYCLMRNHFHLVVETPSANLVEGMRWFLSVYTILDTPGNSAGKPLNKRPTASSPRSFCSGAGRRPI